MLRLVLRGGVNTLVRFRGEFAQDFQFFDVADIAIGARFIGGPFLNNVEGETARQVTSFVSAHAIGYGKKLEAGIKIV